MTQHFPVLPGDADDRREMLGPLTHAQHLRAQFDGLRRGAKCTLGFYWLHAKMISPCRGLLKTWHPWE